MTDAQACGDELGSGGSVSFWVSREQSQRQSGAHSENWDDVPGKVKGETRDGWGEPKVIPQIWPGKGKRTSPGWNPSSLGITEDTRAGTLHSPPLAASCQLSRGVVSWRCEGAGNSALESMTKNLPESRVGCQVVCDAEGSVVPHGLVL